MDLRGRAATCRSKFRQEGILSTEQAKSCRQALLDWHQATRDVVPDARWFTALSAFVRRASRFLQRRLLGRRFYRWIEY